MSAALQREIASKGGRAAHEKGRAHEFTPEEARKAGRKGGKAAHARGTAHRFTSKEAREAGRKGGRHGPSVKKAPLVRLFDASRQADAREERAGDAAGDLR